MQQLKWIQCQGDVWCKLDTVNLNHQHFNNMGGVYIIWHGGSNARTVYVGKGNIKSRLIEHRNNSEIQVFSSLGLYVTWALVLPPSTRDGIEAYLAKRLDPLVGSRHPEVRLIETNLPW